MKSHFHIPTNFTQWAHTLLVAVIGAATCSSAVGCN